MNFYNNFKRNQNNKGFTLIELTFSLALLAIIGIFSFSIIYYFSEYTKRTKEESAMWNEANLIISAIVDEMFSVPKDNIILSDTGESKSYFFSEHILNNSNQDKNFDTYFLFTSENEEENSELNTNKLRRVGFIDKKIIIGQKIIDSKFLVFSPSETEEDIQFSFSYIDKVTTKNNEEGTTESVTENDHYKIFLKMKGKYTSPVFTTYITLIDKTEAPPPEVNGDKKK